MEAISSVTQPANKNVKAEDYLNIDNRVETKADVKEIYEVNENHQQSKRKRMELPNNNLSANNGHTIMFKYEVPGLLLL
jgi:hypothetical protein